jgi:hypothetical protein
LREEESERDRIGGRKPCEKGSREETNNREEGERERGERELPLTPLLLLL